MYQFKARCSGLADLMPQKRGGEGLSDTAKSAVRKIAKFDLFGYQDLKATNTPKKGIFWKNKPLN